MKNKKYTIYSGCESKCLLYIDKNYNETVVSKEVKMEIVVSLSDAARVIKEYQNAGYVYDGSINQDLTCVTLKFKDPNIKDKATYIEFHEGDYVENNDGRTGYVSSICHCDECKKRGFF